MAIKGKQKEESKEFVKELYVGLTSVRVTAINPTRAQMNKMLGKVETDEKEEFKYLDEDKEGNTRLRLAFWMYDELNEKYFVQSITLTDVDRKNNDKNKVQLINATCGTCWVPYKLDGNGEPTNVINDEVVPVWFQNFTNKEKEVIGVKKFKKAVRGEEELGTLLRAWLGRMNWNDIDTEVLIDTKKLFKENYKELRDLIDSDFDTPFTILTGVRTSEEDVTKQYQQVFNKAYLPSGFMTYISKGNKFPSDYSKKVWREFTEKVNDQYGFNCYHELAPLAPYDATKDPASSKSARPQQQPASNEY